MGPYETSIKEAWDRVLGWLDAHDLRKLGPRAFGLFHDHARLTDAAALRYDACVELIPGLSADPASGIVRKITPGGAYAQGHIKGCYGQIGAGFRYMCAQWAEAKNLRIDTSRPFMEIYLNDPATTPKEERLTQLCVPIRTEPDPRHLLHLDDEDVASDS